MKKTDSEGGRLTEPNAVEAKRRARAHEDLLSYWTPERMRSATPVGLERPPPSKRKLTVITPGKRE